MTTHDLLTPAIVGAVLTPALGAVTLGLWTLLTGRTPAERNIWRVPGAGLLFALVCSLVAVVASTGTHEVDLGRWIHVGTYEVPIVFVVDEVALAFSVLAAASTTLVARFSVTYLHKERGFLRFFLLLGLFSSGTQLISYAGVLDLMFLGWEVLGLSSMLFIGFFHERDQPVRSAMRAFATYRVCDAGFLFAIVLAHELLGSTRLTALNAAGALSTVESTTLALLFMFSAIGKSAQLPFSGWLPRALEGPTPSSALFYGGVSIHAGLFLLLRVWPVLSVSPIAQVVGVVVGLATAIYAAAVTRTCSDAKGALAHATLTQVGLILAEISAGLTTLALFHLGGHALLRLWQYLRAPNMIHDAHRTDAASHAPAPQEGSSPFARSLYAASLFRLHIDEHIERAAAAVVALGGAIDRADRKLRGLFSAGAR